LYVIIILKHVYEYKCVDNSNSYLFKILMSMSNDYLVVWSTKVALCWWGVYLCVSPGRGRARDRGGGLQPEWSNESLLLGAVLRLTEQQRWQYPGRTPGGTTGLHWWQPRVWPRASHSVR